MSILSIRQEIRILNAQAAIKELEIKIFERREDIARMEKHMALQSSEIEKATAELNRLKENKDV